MLNNDRKEYYYVALTDRLLKYSKSDFIHFQLSSDYNKNIFKTFSNFNSSRIFIVYNKTAMKKYY